MGRLDGKAAWISGSTQGIGEGVARLFADEGAAVAIVGRNAALGEALAAEITAKGGIALFTQCDVLDAAQVRESINTAAAAFGGLDILVNNAGTVEVKMLHEYGDDEWDRLMDLNVKSAFLAFKYAFPYLSEKQRSYVVNIGSISSFVGQDQTPVYTTSKSALLGLTRSIALDYARHGVRCNCVCPGITDTPLLRFHMGAVGEVEAVKEQRLRRVPLGVALTPEDVAKSVLFFSSEDSAGVTAASLIVDGGYLAAAEWDTALHLSCSEV